MIKNKTILTVSCALLLSSCSMTDMFRKKDDTPHLEGERLSVLELQRSLTADTPLAEGQQFELPAAWDNGAWPQAGGYPNHSMQNLVFTDNAPSIIWKSDIGRGSRKDLPLTAQPVVAGGMVFTLDTNQNVTAFNVQTGKKIWDTDLEPDDEDENVISGGIAYAHDTLYVTTGYDEAVALNPADGSVKWKKRLPSPSRAAPTVLSGRVYISTVDNRLVALSAESGTGLWEYVGIGETAGLLGAASPAANNEIVIAGFTSGELTALRVENGSVTWSDNLSGVRSYGGGLESLSDIKALPVSHHGIVVSISYGGKLVAIDERTGTRMWQRDIGGSQTPWLTANTLFVLSSDNELIALNLLNGSIFWIEQLSRFEDEEDKEDPITWTGPVMVNGRLVLASSHGYIAEVSAHTGKVIRTTRTKKNVQIAPVVAGGTMYLLSEDGTLLAYR